ncbi:unnamed protein product [Polarella glacialis]|uniref:Protein kinase domain-containing protein n=1 Tax=Polarella glacialis TaxID=89957 RepID=A0A813DVM6_POLGL|nr:unnamed protein product [Polarella glacialis]CAE8734672.1 unnamed protein product [Polarella glacialis]|mmetsp:Transcript_41399/g.66886  ORF Transcript_41399/g.66886 Transcript_41399/m.66886 type:complete len:347 (+) Transcript_41399:156-1196(+)
MEPGMVPSAPAMARPEGMPAAPGPRRIRTASDTGLPKRPPSPDCLAEPIKAVTLDSWDLLFPCIASDQLRYEESVGRGNTFEVFRGTFNGKDVAIKKTSVGNRVQARKRHVMFSREAAILGKVKHPNLAVFYGVCFDEQELCVITEFCLGGCCHELLHHSSDMDLSWPQKLKMCRDVACAMHYLHSLQPQIIHRDLKSMNLFCAQFIFADTIPLIKVSDLGMARMKDLEEEWQRMTKAVGSCHWMAPEVMSGTYGVTADVYSYSMCLFEIICRLVPWPEDEGSDIIEAVLSGERPDVTEVPPDCPAKLKDLMIACWAHDPTDRPTSREIIDILASVRLLKRIKEAL